MVGKYAIEQWARVPVDVELAHEFRYRDPVIGARTLVVSISQSGETMDTLMAVKYARERGARTLSICNTQGATIPRESDAVALHARRPRGRGRVDQGVRRADHRAAAARPARRSQCAGRSPPRESAAAVAELEALPAKIAEVLASSRRHVAQLAGWMADTRSVLFLGRHVGYPIALEGALKLKEISRTSTPRASPPASSSTARSRSSSPASRCSCSCRSPRTPRCCTRRSSRTSRRSAPAAPASSRSPRSGDAAVLPFADEVIRIPLAAPLFEPLLAVVPLQIFAMELATAKGLDVDQPRNLAKSVTVE